MFFFYVDNISKPQVDINKECVKEKMKISATEIVITNKIIINNKIMIMKNIGINNFNKINCFSLKNYKYMINY